MQKCHECELKMHDADLRRLASWIWNGYYCSVTLVFKYSSWTTASPGKGFKELKKQLLLLLLLFTTTLAMILDCGQFEIYHLMY